MKNKEPKVRTARNEKEMHEDIKRDMNEDEERTRIKEEMKKHKDDDELKLIDELFDLFVYEHEECWKYGLDIDQQLTKTALPNLLKNKGFTDADLFVLYYSFQNKFETLELEERLDDLLDLDGERISKLREKSMLDLDYRQRIKKSEASRNQK